VHHIVTAEDPSQGCARQRIENLHPRRRSGQKSCPFSGTSIPRLQHQPSRGGTQVLTRLFEAGHGLPGASGEADEFSDPLDERRLKQGTEIRGKHDRTTCCPSECPNQPAICNPFSPPFLSGALRTSPVRFFDGVARWLVLVTRV
jgi:hypothetical protein